MKDAAKEAKRTHDESAAFKAAADAMGSNKAVTNAAVKHQTPAAANDADSDESDSDDHWDPDSQGMSAVISSEAKDVKKTKAVKKTTKKSKRADKRAAKKNHSP